MSRPSYLNRLAILVGYFLTSIVAISVVCADSGEDAKAAFDRKDYETAQEIWSDLADKGDSSAALQLGLMYLNGYSVDQDTERGLKLLHQSAESGNPDAQNILGDLYVRGEKIPKDLALGQFWIQKAAEQRHGYALLDLAQQAFIRAQVTGASADRVSAVMWLELALESVSPSDPAYGFILLNKDTIMSDVSQDEIDQAKAAAMVWSQAHPR